MKPPPGDSNSEWEVRIPEGWRRAFGLSIAVILAAPLVAILGAFLIFRAHLTLQDLSDTNVALIEDWRALSDQVDYLLDENQSLVNKTDGLIIQETQGQIRDLLVRAADLERQYESQLTLLRQERQPFWDLSDHENAILEQDIPQRMKSRVAEAGTAVLTIVRGGFSHWDAATKITFQSGSLIAPLRERQALLTDLNSRSAVTIWQSLLTVAVVLSGLLIFVWLALLRPAMRDLAAARREMRLIFDAIPSMVTSYSATGHFEMSNIAYRKISAHPVVGNHVSQVLAPSLWNAVKDRFESALRGNRVNFDHPMTTENGVRMHNVRYEPLIGPDGKVSRVIVMITDVQDRYDNVRALGESEEKLRITLDSIGDAVISTDIDGVIVRMNPVACQLTGWPVSEAVGRPLDQVLNIVSQQSRNKVESPVDKVMATGKVVGLANHTVLISRDGREYFIRDSGAPIRSSDGEMVGVVLVFRDAAEEISLNERVVRNEKTRAIGQLVDGISHDFNNQLAIIRGYSELLAWKSETLCADDALNQIISTCDHVAGLIRRLQAFSQESNPEISALDVKALLAAVVGIVRDTVDKRISVSLNCDVDDARSVGNPDLLKSAFMNICLNAMQAMKTSGVLTITLDRYELTDRAPAPFLAFDLPKGPYLRVVFRDNGPGIPLENLDRVFEPYFSTKASGGGGMGLAMAFTAVLECRGAIIAENAADGGAAITILLPHVPEDPASAPDAAPRRAPEPGDLEGLSVLFVDDEADLRSTWAFMLSDVGCVVMTAEDGAEALQRYRENAAEIDIVLLDVTMPNMNGIEVFERLKEINPGVRVVLMTGAVTQIRPETAEDPALAAILAKPFRFVDLVQVLARTRTSGGAS